MQIKESTSYDPNIDAKEIVDSSLAEIGQKDISWWFNPEDKRWNPTIIFAGQKSRLRSGILIVKGDEVLLSLEKGDEGNFSLPGGGLDKDESLLDAAVREAKEEVHINVKNARYTGCDYCEIHTKVMPWVKKHIPEKEWWFNYYTCLIIADYDSEYKGKVAKVDQDDTMLDNRKWYKISEVVDKPSFKPQWKKALIKFGYLKEEKQTKTLYHLSEKKINKLTPRIPESKYEEQETPRICFSDSIQGCLIGLNEDKDATGKTYYVYSLKTNDYYKPTEKEVADVKLTNEYWILKECKPEYLYDIKITGIKEYKKANLNNKEINIPVYDYKKVENLKEEYLDEDKQIYTTTSVYEVAKLIKQENSYSIRILWDKKLDRYFICNVDDFIHQDMVEKAVEQGYYGNNLPRWMIPEYVDTYGNVVYFIYAPTDLVEHTYGCSISEDGYDDNYKYEFGVLAVRNYDEPDNLPLIKALGNNRQHFKLNGWIDSYKPEILQVESLKEDLKEDLNQIKPENEPKILHNIIYQNNTLNLLTFKNNIQRIENRQLQPLDIAHKIQEINIDDIYTSQITPEVDYANKYKKYAEDSAPPIIVIQDGSKYYLQEGNHRVLARQYYNKKTIKAIIFNLQDIKKALLKYNYLKEDLNTITVYHGTPFKSSAENILKYGLDVNKAKLINGGKGSMPSIKGLNYIALEKTNAIRYANMNHDEPTGYIFTFNIDKKDLLPDEDALGHLLWCYYHKSSVDGTKYINDKNLKSIIDKLPKDYQDKLKQDENGSFELCAEVGRYIFGKLDKKEIEYIIDNSKTMTTRKILRPTKLEKINKKLIDWNSNISSDQQLLSLLREGISVKKLNDTEFFNKLKATKIENERFELSQFEKNKGHNDGIYCLIDNDEILAAALIQKNILGLNDTYINEIQTIKKGYGKLLLKELFKQPNVWLSSMPGVNELLNYYRQFNLKEVILDAKDTVENTEMHLFTNIKDIDKFTQAIKRRYGPSIEEDLKDDAKKHFGITKDPKLGFYINTDGTLLDGSGKAIGGAGNVRSVDHREIADIFKDGIEGTEAMNKYMAEGNIRYMPETNGFDIMVEPNAIQYKVIQAITDRLAGLNYESYLVISNKQGNPLYHNEYSDPLNLVPDLKDYFRNNKVSSKWIKEEYLFDTDNGEYIKDAVTTDNKKEYLAFLARQKEPQRIYYDKNINRYFIFDAEKYIHINMLGVAVWDGYYKDNKELDAYLRHQDRRIKYLSKIKNGISALFIPYESKYRRDREEYPYSIETDIGIMCFKSKLDDTDRKYLTEKIVKIGSKYQVQSEKGRNMGTYDTKAEAKKRLQQIEYFKHKNEGVENLVFYHGTYEPKIIKAFNQPINWFTTNIEYARGFGDHIYTCKLLVKNAFEAWKTDGRIFKPYPATEPYEFTKEFKNILLAAGISEQAARDEIDLLSPEVYSLYIFSFIRTEFFANTLKEQGYDSILTLEFGSVCIGVLKPELIKIRQLLQEATRTQQINDSKTKGDYKDQSRGKNRFERKKYSTVSQSTQSFNTIDMNDFFKKDILEVKVPVRGESDDYIVTIKMEGVVKEIARNIKANRNKFEYKDVIQAITKIYNTTDIYTKCECDDFLYNFAHWNIINNVSVDDTAHDPGPGKNIKNPNDDKGRGCKHILLVLANTDWLMKVANVIRNYIIYADEHMKAAFNGVIFPKLYGINIEDAGIEGLVPKDIKLEDEKSALDTINKWSGKSRVIAKRNEESAEEEK